MSASSLPYRASNALDFQANATAAMGGRVVDTDFAGIELIQAAVLALGDIGHDHIGARLQGHDAPLGV